MLTSPAKSLVYFESDKLCISDGAVIRPQIDVKCCTRMGVSAQLCVPGTSHILWCNLPAKCWNWY